MKKVFYIFLLGMALLVAFDYFSFEKYLCDTYSCSSKIEGTLLAWFIITAINFLIVVGIRFINRNGFNLWWKFSRIATPVALLVSLIINLGLHHNPGGWFNIDNEKDLVMMFAIYVVFIIGSLIQIYRGYKK